MATLLDIQKLYNDNNLGQFTVYTNPKTLGGGNYLYIPPVAGFNGGYFKIDQASIDQLDQSKIKQGGDTTWFDSGGISHTAFTDAPKGAITNGNWSSPVSAGSPNYLENIQTQVQSQTQQTAEAQRVQQLNSAIKSGDTATVEKLSPGYTLWNGAFMQKSQVSEAQANGSTVKNGNVVGPDVPGLGGIPKTQTLADQTGGGFKTPAYKVAVPVTPQNPGGFDVYDAQGNKLTMADLQKGPNGNPTINLTNLPVQSAPSGTGGSGGSSGTGGSTTTSTTFDHTKAGVSDTNWNSMSPAQQALIEGAWKKADYDYNSTGLSNVSVNTQLLNDAMHLASTDQGILARYGDALTLDKVNLTKSLANANADWAQSQGLLNTQQEQDRKALAELEASKGLAFSGFRNQAQNKLNTEQGGIIASSKRDMQAKVDAQGQALEQKYGSGNLGQFGDISVGGMAYNPVNGLTGTEDIAKRNEIQAKGLSNYNFDQSPLA